MSIFGDYLSEQYGVDSKAKADGFVIGYVNCVANGGRAEISCNVAAQTPPGVLRGCASAHNYTSDDRWGKMASFTVPFHKGENYQCAQDVTSAPQPAMDLTAIHLGDGTNVFLGDWESINLNSSISAPADGFVVAYIRAVKNGDRGYLVCGSPAFPLAATSVHWYTDDDVWYPAQSFLMPVHKNTFYNVQFTSTAGQPQAEAYFIPLQGGLRLGAFTPITAENNQNVPVETDGFVVGILTAADGGRATLTVQAGEPSNSAMSAGTSVHFYTGSDTWLPENMVVVPVPAGGWYQYNCQVTSAPVTRHLYWAPLLQA